MFVIDMIRHNHGGVGFDGLDNKNAADAKGQELLMQTGFHVDNCHMALYHVHVSEVSMPNQETAVGGHDHFANYLSCNPSAGSPGGYSCVQCNQPDCVWFGSDCAKAGDNQFSKDHIGMGALHHKADNSDGVWYSCPYEGHIAKNWRRDKDYQKAACHAGITAAEIKNAFHASASMFLRQWDADVSAFLPEDAAANQSTNVVAV